MKYEPKALEHTADISRGRSSLRSRLQFVAGVLITLVVMYFALGFLAEGLARLLPDSWERQLASMSMLLFSEESDHEDFERPRAILAHLMEGEELRDLDYGIHRLDFDSPNAAAFPGGPIGVTPDLLELIESEVGLAFVLAHELGHHENRDNLRRMGRRLIFDFVVGLITGSSTSVVIRGPLDASESAFSRGQERAADEYAMHLIHRKYDDLDGALEFFQDMLDDESGLLQMWQQYFGSHPVTSERIERLEKLAAELRG